MGCILVYGNVNHFYAFSVVSVSDHVLNLSVQVFMETYEDFQDAACMHVANAIKPIDDV